jgi:hypothetical protein
MAASGVAAVGLGEQPAKRPSASVRVRMGNDFIAKESMNPEATSRNEMILAAAHFFKMEIIFEPAMIFSE